MSLPDIFGADLAGVLNEALGPLVFDQTLIKITSIRDPSNPTKRLSTETSFPCRGFIDVFEDGTLSGTGIKITDRKIVILGASLPSGIEPVPGDKITAEGTTFTIVPNGVVRDPAGATFECQSK